jgi:hypothetical protein
MPQPTEGPEAGLIAISAKAAAAEMKNSMTRVRVLGMCSRGHAAANPGAAGVSGPSPEGPVDIRDSVGAANVIRDRK